MITIFTRSISRNILRKCSTLPVLDGSNRCSHGGSEQEADKPKNLESTQNLPVPLECRFMYPEFLPDPLVRWRNPVREKLERSDMLKRRANIEIPEFYVGSIVAVTFSTAHSPSKNSKFVGICIYRGGCGLRAAFTLRNVIDHLGTELMFRLHDPTLQKIEVLRLEKRMDDDLFYLRDALPEYSTVPLDMEMELHPDGMPVPVNTTKVKLKPRPWTARWERRDYKGIEDIKQHLNEKMIKQMEAAKTPWERFDLMKQYRSTIPEEEQKVIFSEVYSELHHMELAQKKMKRKHQFTKPKKTG